MTGRQIYDCARAGCHAISNGNLGGWWALCVREDVLYLVPIAQAERFGSYAFTVYCGTRCALAAISDAMSTMQERERMP